MPVFLDPSVTVLIASRNADKARELIELWGPQPPRLSLPPPEYPDIPETAGTYEGNALLKARALADLCGAPALADDSGIEVEALDWGPGVLSARAPSAESTWAERNGYVIKAANAYGSRRARYVCVCALVIPGSEPVIARGQVEGLIADTPRGSNGFGYDPIFVYPPYDGKTFGEVTSAMKHAVSHRGRAVRALREQLDFRPSGALKRTIEGLPHPMQVAFLLLTIERMMPALEQFAADEKKFVFSPFREGLNAGWSFLAGSDIGVNKVRLAEQCMKHAPDMDDYRHDLKSEALNTALSIATMLEFLTDAKVEHVLEIIGWVRDSASFAAQRAERPTDLGILEMTTHPFSRQEVQREWGDIAFLASLQLDAHNLGPAVKSRASSGEDVLVLSGE